MIVDDIKNEYVNFGMDQYKPSADSITIFSLDKLDPETAEKSARRPIGEIALILNSLIAKGSLSKVKQL